MIQGFVKFPTPFEPLKPQSDLSSPCCPRQQPLWQVQVIFCCQHWSLFGWRRIRSKMDYSRFDLNKLNIDYGAEGNSPWYSTPSPSPHEAFAELPPSSSSSTSFSSTPSSSSTTSSPWDRLQEMEEPLPHNFKENAFSNLAVRWVVGHDGTLITFECGTILKLLCFEARFFSRWGKMDVGEGQPTLLPAVPAVPGKQGVEYTFRRARSSFYVLFTSSVKWKIWSSVEDLMDILCACERNFHSSNPQGPVDSNANTH